MVPRAEDAQLGTCGRDAPGGTVTLVLLGDILDFSVASYDEAFAAARVFFDAIKRDKIAAELIYVPGNHDFDAWHMIEHEVNVTRRLRAGKLPESFRWSVPGVLGPDSSSILLPKVGTHTGSGTKYGGLALDGLATNGITVNVAYPNLYVKTTEGTALLTHGHYLAKYWQAASDVGLEVASTDLDVGELDLEELVSINFPLNQLASSGVGQAGKLTALVRIIQREVKDGDLKRVRRYLKRLDDNVLDPMIGGKPYEPKEWASDVALNLGVKWISDALERLRPARHDARFFKEPDVRERFGRYYAASTLELDLLCRQYPEVAAIGLEAPTRFVCGHTHVPIPWAHLGERFGSNGSPVYVHNTGGWLRRHPNEPQIHAEVFIYSDGKVHSTPVR